MMTSFVNVIDKPYSGRLETVRFVLPLLVRKKVLYVGAKGSNGGFLVHELIESQNTLTFLEAWNPNCDVLKKHFVGFTILNDTIQNLLKNTNDRWDSIVWWHGPEHVELYELKWIIPELTKRAKIVLLRSPYGEYQQGDEEGNPNEIHKTSMTPVMYQDWGFNTFSLKFTNGDTGVGSHITAWYIGDEIV